MQPLDFLGGKYQQPEQIVPGDVQTFRAQEAATGRTVFIHRLSTMGNEREQTALLRLLLASLFRSPNARNQVLDFGDEPGFCYIVTESAPQCLLLREWLQYELDHGLDPTRLSRPLPSSPSSPLDLARTDLRFTGAAPPPPATPVAPNLPALDSTRLFTPNLSLSNPLLNNPPPRVVPAADVAPKAQNTPSPAPPPVSAVQPPIEEAGDFTRLFAGPSMTRQPEPPPKPADLPKSSPVSPQPPPPAAPSQNDSGDFTRFFNGGLPAAAPPKPAAPRTESFRGQDRPSQSDGYVQRPNSITPAPSHVTPGAPGSVPPAEAGEFTKMFNPRSFDSGPRSAPPKPAEPKPNFPPPGPLPSSGFDTKAFEPNRFDYSAGRSSYGSGDSPGKDLPDLSRRKSDLPDMFNSAPEVPTPMKSASQEPGEYTRIFGKGETPPPSAQTPGSVPAPPLPVFDDDPLQPARPRPPAAHAPAQAAGPSEFTRVIQGNRTPEDGAPGAAGHAAPAAGGSSGGAPPIDVKITPMSPNMLLQGAGMASHLGGGMVGGGGMGVGGVASGPHVSGAGMSLGHASASSPVGSAHVGGGGMMPQSLGAMPPLKPIAPPKQAKDAMGLAKKEGLASKKNLIILFVVLALLAIVLVIVLIRQK